LIGPLITRFAAGLRYPTLFKIVGPAADTTTER
jgi:hypothetical protein